MIDEPLVRALASEEAVAFVGSGASIPSGLPDWRKFLRAMLDYACKLPGTEWSRTEQLWNDGDYLLAAELLQRELPVPTFTRFIEQTFRRDGLEPNEIHRSIARLPFSLALTTNIDSLLEAAYRNPATFTWRDTDAVFNAIRSRHFAVVKLHGSVTDPFSARLTRTHYRDGTLSNSEFNECIRHLLTWKTFLFVGYSLRDSDLLYLMDEARVRFGTKFGPHYAIMPDDEADAKFQGYLRAALSIETITYRRDKENPGSATSSVVNILKALAGRVSKARYGQYGISLGLNNPSLTRNQVAQAVLDKAAPMTGSMRGDICMIQDDIYPKLSPVATFPRRREVQLAATVKPGSVIESVFLQAVQRDHVYLSNIANSDEQLRQLGYTNASYFVCDTAVQSELACPIVADGRRVGTLNLESDLVDAYTPEHIDVAVKVADELGRIYLQSEQRRRTAAPIEDLDQNPMRLANLMELSRLIKAQKHDFLLYVIDYENRRLNANHASRKKIEYGFDVKSLAGQVFQTRSPTFVQDAEAEVRKLASKDDPSTAGEDVWLNPTGVDQYDIRGSVFGCPVRAAGQTEAVLITWLREPKSADFAGRLKLFRSSSNQVMRLANLLANDIYRPGTSRVESFLTRTYSMLEKIDGGKVWTKDNLSDSLFCSNILDALLAATLLPELGLKRVRIWRSVTSPQQIEPVAFKLVKWLVASDIQDQPASKYLKAPAFSSDNPFSQYTISRYRQDPLAKWQHPALFPAPDPRCVDLDKDPNGSWIVAPIVKMSKTKTELLGFLSADTHVPTADGPKDQRSDDPREIALQCRALDVIADLARFVLKGNDQRFSQSTTAGSAGL